MFKNNIILFICLFAVFGYGDKVNYWELVPDGVIHAEDGTKYIYKATVLNHQKNGVLLYIKDGKSSDRYVQAWGKGQEIMSYFLGDEVLVSIAKNDPSHLEILGSSDFEIRDQLLMNWDYTDAMIWEIPENIRPVNSTLLRLNGMDYAIYDGKITSCVYEKWIEDGWEDDETAIHQLEMDVVLSETLKHHVFLKESIRFVSSDGRHIRGTEDLTNQYLKMLRAWKESDEIKILVNQCYSGFWWVVNETRNEAVFFAQENLFDWDENLWNRLS